MNNANLARRLSVLALLAVAAGPVKAVPMLDFVILMDASGSAGSSGWALEQSFVIDLIGTGLPATNRNVGIVRYASASTTSVVYSFADDQSPAALTSFVNDLAYTGGQSHALTALETGIELFDLASPGSNIRRMLLLADGDAYPSSQNPCDGFSLKNEIDSRAIEMFVGTFGAGPSAGYYDCLVDDPSSQSLRRWTRPTRTSTRDSAPLHSRIRTRRRRFPNLARPCSLQRCW